MQGLLKALFDTECKSKTSSEKPSLASLFPQTGSQPANEARQATKSEEKFLVPSIDKTAMNPASELPLLPKSSSAVHCDGCPRLHEPLHAGRLRQATPSSDDVPHAWAPELVPPTCPAMPKGIRLIRWEPKSAPVAIDVCSVVVDVSKFIAGELRALDSRLNDPMTIHGGFTVPQMLDRLAQVGVTVALALDPLRSGDR